jgi:hypothetical protein
MSSAGTWPSSHRGWALRIYGAEVIGKINRIPITPGSPKTVEEVEGYD